MEKLMECSDEQFTELCSGIKYDDITKFLLELHKYDPYCTVEIAYHTEYVTLLGAFIVGGAPAWAVQLVIDYGNTIYPNFIHDVRNKHLLYDACEFQNAGAVKLLLDYGFDVNAPIVSSFTGISHTPIDYIAGIEDIEILKILIDHGADINHVGNSGYTPIHIAAINRRLENIEMLIEAGADLSIKDSKGVDGYSYIENEGFDQHFPEIDFNRSIK